jgi:hypothetical protein
MAMARTHAAVSHSHSPIRRMPGRPGHRTILAGSASHYEIQQQQQHAGIRENECAGQ